MVVMGIVMNAKGAINNVTKELTLKHQDNLDV
jgi:hypothetical protein